MKLKNELIGQVAW